MKQNILLILLQSQSIDRGYLAQLSDPITDFVYDYAGASETTVICPTL